MFNRFFGGGGGLGGGFGPFGGMSCSGTVVHTLVLTKLRRGNVRCWTTIRIQYGRRSWNQSTSIWWSKTKKEASRPKCAARPSCIISVNAHGTPTTTVHSCPPHPLLHLFWGNLDSHWPFYEI
jgi:hypothetical protein